MVSHFPALYEVIRPQGASHESQPAMRSLRSRFEAPTYALLRMVTGFLFLWHGTQKLFDFPPSGHEAPALVIYVGGGVELVGGLLVMLGFLTRPAAFICSGQMAVAYWMAHGTKAVLPIVNGGELAVLYCFVFLFVSANGAGHWSVDSRLSDGASSGAHPKRPATDL